MKKVDVYTILLEKEQNKKRLRNISEVFGESISQYLDPLLDHLEDINDHSAYLVIEAMLKYHDVNKFKEAAARWIKRTEQGHL